MSVKIYDAPVTITKVAPLKGNIVLDPLIPDYVVPLDVDILKNKPTLPALDYTNLDFSSIKLQLLNLLKANIQNFGYSVRDFADSNSAGMMLNLYAHMGQMLSYHNDSTINELFLDTAQSNIATSKLLSVYGYKQSRPKSAVILFSITRAKSVSSDSYTREEEDSSELLLSNSLNRYVLTVDGSSYELFPAKMVNGNLEPDYLNDLIIPAYIKAGVVGELKTEYDESILNTYVCYGLSGKTISEDYESSGLPNQVIELNTSYVNDAPILVQVEDKSVVIPGRKVYSTWKELPYLSLAGFRSNSNVLTDVDGKTPYLTTNLKLDSTTYSLKKSNRLQLGTLLKIDYNNQASIAGYSDYKKLTVPYRLGVLSALQPTNELDDNYVQVLLYHPKFIYSDQLSTSAINMGIVPLVSYVYDRSWQKISWREGEILYLLNAKKIINANGTVKVSPDGTPIVQPQIVSESQLLLANSELYPELVELKNNIDFKIAIGKSLGANQIAFGLSADEDTQIFSDPVYEMTWDGSFKPIIRFGDGIFGKIPDKSAAIKIIYRANNNIPTRVISAYSYTKDLVINNVSFNIVNMADSSPETSGESLEDSKKLATRFFASQDRAVNGQDYSVLTQKFNSNIKVVPALSKVDADANTVRLYTLIRRNLGVNSEVLEAMTLTEKLELRNFLNKYKCIGVDLEIVDGIIRELDLRLDLRIKPGYIAGQVKTDLVSSITDFFSISKTRMGEGLNSAELLKAISKVVGISSMDIYLGGISSIYDALGNEVVRGEKIYQQLMDIRPYDFNVTEFPAFESRISVISDVTALMQPFEIIHLNSLLINTATR